jgi:hypothetical protein
MEEEMKTQMNQPQEIELILQELFFWEEALQGKVLCGHATRENIPEYISKNTGRTNSKGGQQ